MAAERTSGDAGAKAQALAAELEKTNHDLDTAHGLLAQALRNSQAAKAQYEAEDAAKSAELASARQAAEAASASADGAAKAQALAAQLDQAKTDLAATRAQLADAQRGAEASKADADDKVALEKQVADLTDRLNVATRAATLSQEENTRLTRSVPVRPSATVASVRTPTPVPTPEERTHTVVEGDTLTKISLEYYGTASRWQAIYQANRDSMPNEGSLSIGTVLRIP